MAKILKQSLRKIGIDGALAFTILTRLVQGAGGIVSIVFIAKFLSPDEQGYYYTFASILAIQAFFELGLGSIITQYTAYEFAHLKWNNNFELIGEDYYKSRLSSLLRFCVKWFAIIGGLLFVILLVVGYVFFYKYNAVPGIDWQKPWIILCLATTFNFFIDPVLAFFDGLGFIKDMSKVRLFQKSAFTFLLFVFFACGFKLYSGGLASLISISVNYFQIAFTNRKRFLYTVWVSKAGWVISYVKEILPYQWRIAISWISGYFIFQLFNPVLFATEGPKAAGQMGMTLQVINGISLISLSWITTKVPAFSQFIARQEYKQLDKLFNQTLKNLLIVNFALLALFNITIQIFKYYHIVYADRFLQLTPLLIMSITCLLNQLIYSWAAYLRCHKKEPFLLHAIVMAMLITLSTILLGNRFGVIGIVGGYGFVITFISLTWAYLLFTTKKKLWHLVSE